MCEAHISSKEKCQLFLWNVVAPCKDLTKNTIIRELYICYIIICALYYRLDLHFTSTLLSMCLDVLNIYYIFITDYDVTVIGQLIHWQVHIIHVCLVILN